MRNGPCRWRITLAGFVIVVTTLAQAAHADTIYKSVGGDGKVTYSDKPPTGAKVQKTLEYRDLPATPLPESVRRWRDALIAGNERPAADAGQTATAQLFTATWCGYCRKAKAHLTRRGIAFRELDVESPSGMQAYAGIGGSGVPVLLWRHQRIDGYSAEAYDAIADAISAR